MWEFIRFLFGARSRTHRLKHYIKPISGPWNMFRLFMLGFALTSSAATVNWEVSNIQNPSNRAIYGFIGDTAFRQQSLDSLANSTFSQFITSNPTALKGNYIADNTGYIKSIDFSGANNKSMTMFIVMLDGNNPDNYNYADITSTKTIAKLNPTAVNTFSFDGSTGLTRVNNIPEPNTTLLLIIGTSVILLCRRGNYKVVGI